ncbi:MAG: PEP-CTERM sorting domain-containing protein [Nitrospirae bacterium]|nr:PEP-CTERM sorting domain-containing protein [Nitrospirota bacterium]
MKTNKYLTLIIAFLVLMLSATIASATPSASILYNETSPGEGLWRYDYTFNNTSTNNEYLYYVRLDFGGNFEIANTTIPNGWTGTWALTGPANFIESHTNNLVNDISPNSSKGAFSFTINSKIGSVPYTAYFDDHLGTRLKGIGMTTVVPEPLSYILFGVGGVVLGARRYLKRKRSS